MIRWTIRKLRNWATMTPARAVMVMLALLAVLAAGGLGIYKLAQPDLSCAPGVQERGPMHECTGVTDGSYTFAPMLAKVEAAILKENRSVADQRHATVALLIPFTSSDPTVQAAVLHVIQGAYIAQYLANHDPNDTPPPIRLVLANPGQDFGQWRPVARQLASMTGSPDNLRAVTGIGRSTDTTQREVGWLTRHGIPVVGGSITADSIANGPASDPFPGLVRVAATNTAEAEALAHYAKVKPRQAYLVEDIRTGDDYITTLRKAFSKKVPKTAIQPFRSPQDITQEGQTSNLFLQTVQNICIENPPIRWIYFAGRQVQLRQFINELAARACREQSYTILTGDAASHLAHDPKLDRNAFAFGITLDYAALASPDAWKSMKRAGGSLNGQFMDSQRAYMNFHDALTQQAMRIDPVDLADGQAIINYDAVLTAITAIRNMATPSTPMPKLQDIINEWSVLHAHNKILGASGWICLDNFGNPYDKAIPIVSYTRGKPVFVALAWPNDGKPPKYSCPAP